MKFILQKLFICFSAKDRYDIAQPIVYHLKNYGINVWYDRYEMVMGDNRIEKNINEGAGNCNYAIIIISHNTKYSLCATEEIELLKSRYYKNEVIIFPVLYDIKPNKIPHKFRWITNMIFKEVNHASGTLEICNHIACKITQDILANSKYKTLNEIIVYGFHFLPKPIFSLLKKYKDIDTANLNSRITLLYSVYLIIIETQNLSIDSLCEIPTKVFERLFTETLLNLTIDYRELWLLENSICILIDYYFVSCKDSKI